MNFASPTFSSFAAATGAASTTFASTAGTATGAAGATVDAACPAKVDRGISMLMFSPLPI